MAEWGNPLKPKKAKKEDKEPKAPKELAKFKPEKLTLPKSEAKKILNLAHRTPTTQQTAWVQRWLEQLVRERTLPPQLVGAEAYGQICLFLSPDDSLKVLEQIRADFGKTLPLETQPSDEFHFLRGLGELEAYHEHLLQPQDDDHNSHLSDDDP
jgi:hypothetical protein